MIITILLNVEIRIFYLKEFSCLENIYFMINGNKVLNFKESISFSNLLVIVM